MPDSEKPLKRPEPEHGGSVWKHPYMIYVLLNLLLFAVVGFVGWLFYVNGWIPNR